MSKQVAIIGAGPIGLELAIALKRAGVDYIHFEGGSIGETIVRYPPRTGLYSAPEGLAIAGVPIQPGARSCTREKYLAYLRRVSEKLRLDVRTHNRVISIRRRDGLFELGSLTPDGKIHTCLAGTVVIATGSLSIPRRLNIPGEHLPHVSHYLGEPNARSGRAIVVVGGRNSALEAVLCCYENRDSVTLSYRRAALCPIRAKSWLVHQVNALIRSGDVRALFRTVPKSITRTHVLLESEEGERFEVPADVVLLMTGYLPDVSLLRFAGVRLNAHNHAPFFSAETMETNVKGLYVAGAITAGAQDDVRVFIETCHPHVERIMAAILPRM
jgi:thioredoxin reductase (NADPH)